MCVCLRVRQKRTEAERESKKPRYKELLCSARRSITGLAGLIQNGSEPRPRSSGPAGRLEARDEPTAELHPVCPSSNCTQLSPQWATAATSHSRILFVRASQNRSV